MFLGKIGYLFPYEGLHVKNIEVGNNSSFRNQTAALLLSSSR